MLTHKMLLRDSFHREQVYGFDEKPQTEATATAINTMFGAVKRRFPGMRTMAALRWSSARADAGGPRVPGLDAIAGSLDVLVQLYSLWNATDAAYWRGLGGLHEAWAYVHRSSSLLRFCA